MWDLENRIGRDFRSVALSISNQGSSDYAFRQAIIYQKNFMDNLRDLADNNDYFEIIYEYLNKIRNPIQLYETAQRSRALQDFFQWYHSPGSYGEFGSSSELAKYILNEYGITYEGEE